MHAQGASATSTRASTSPERGKERNVHHDCSEHGSFQLSTKEFPSRSVEAEDSASFWGVLSGVFRLRPYRHFKASSGKSCI